MNDSDVWLLGFCAASYPAVTIAVDCGYNGIITEFSVSGGIFFGWNDNDPEKAKYISRWKCNSEKNKDISFDDLISKICEYTGRNDPQNTTREFLDKIAKTCPQKLKIPQFYLFAGRHEETWRLFGKETCDKLNEYGINHILTLDENDFDHFESIPRFIEYFRGLLPKLGIV